MFDFQRFEGEIFVGENQISGRVSSVFNSTTHQKILLTNAKINGENVANITLTIYDGFLSIGNVVELTAKINTVQVFELGRFASETYKNNSPYYVTIEYENIQSVTEGSLTFLEKLKINSKNLLSNVMSEDAAELSYSVLFGDKSSLSYEITNSFSKSGIGHVLSVSGLHVGVLILFVNFLLKKFKLKNWVKLSIIFALLVFYNILCNFSPSVLRASIMALVLLSAGVLGRPYDLLNSLSIAGLLILFANPLSIFDVGFQLSFMSVFAIILFYNPINKFFIKKLKFPKIISSPLAITLSVQVALLPLIANYFGEVSLLSPIANLLIVPIFEVAYILLFVITLLAWLFPFISYALLICEKLFNFIIFSSNLFSSLEFSIIKLFAIDTLSLILFFVGMFFVSGFVMAKAKTKYFVVNLLLITSILLAMVNSLPAKFSNLTIFESGNYNLSYSLIISPNNQKLLIGNLDSTEDVVKFLNRAKIDKIDYVVSLNQNYEQNPYYTDFKNQYGVQKTILIGQEDSLSDFEISGLELTPQTKVMFIKVFGHNIAYFNKSLSSLEQENFEYLTADLSINIVINDFYVEQLELGDYKINPNMLKTPNQTFNTLNNWQMEIKNGILKKVRSINWNLQNYQPN